MYRRGLLFAFVLFLLLSISNAVPLSSCDTLSSNTNYEVTQDLYNNYPCLTVSNQQNIVVDLQGHKVYRITIENSNNITVKNGVLYAHSGDSIYYAYSSSSNLTILNISHGSVGPIYITDSNGVYIYNTSGTTSSAGYFIYLAKNVDNALIENVKYTSQNDFTNCGSREGGVGIDIDYKGAKSSDNITITSADIEGTCYGIYSHTENITIYNNVLDTVSSGIVLESCGNSTNITDNMGKDSLYPIIYLQHNSSESYSPGTVSGLIFCNISNFQVTGPTAIYGNIQLVNSTNNTFNSFSVRDTYKAIVLDSSTNNNFYNGQINNTMSGVLFYTVSTTSTGNSFENITGTNISDRVIGGVGMDSVDWACNTTVNNVSLNGLPVWFNHSTNGITVSANLNELTFCDVENSTISGTNITNGTGFWSYSSKNILIENSNFSFAHLHNLYSFYDENITIQNTDMSNYSSIPNGGWSWSNYIYRSSNITFDNISSYGSNGMYVGGGSNFSLFNSRLMYTKYGADYMTCEGYSGPLTVSDVKNVLVENNTVVSYDDPGVFGINLGQKECGRFYCHPYGNITVRNNSISVYGSGVSVCYIDDGYYAPGSSDFMNITQNTITNTTTGLFFASNVNTTEVSFNRIENRTYYSSTSTYGLYSYHPTGFLSRATNVSIFNNTIHNRTYGYYASYGWRDWLYNNTICNVSYVFYLYHSSEIFIGNNSICDDIDVPIGIISDNSTECLHNINFTVNDTNSVYFSNEDNIVYENDDTVAQIFLCNVSYGRVQNITMKRGNLQYGIWMILTKYTNITDFKCYDMDKYGVNEQHLDYEDRIFDSVFVNNTDGIYISENSNTTYVYNNSFENNTNSVDVRGDFNNIYNNSFKYADAGDSDVFVFFADGNNISNNTFETKDAYASKIYSSDNTLFEWNTVNGTNSVFVIVDFYVHDTPQNNTFRYNVLNGPGTGTAFYNHGNNSKFYNNTINGFQYGVDSYRGNNTLLYHNFFYNITNYYIRWSSGYNISLNTSVGGVAQGNYYDDILNYSIYDSDDNSYCDYGDDYPYKNPPSPKLPGTPQWKDWGPIILGGIYDHPDGADESTYSALYLSKYIHDDERHFTTSLIQYNHSTNGLRLGVIGKFHWGDVNMSNTRIYTGVLNTGGNYTVVNATSATGIESTISIFVPNLVDQGVFVCPNAESPEELTYDCEGYTSFDITECQAGSTKNGITVNLITFLGQEYYNITHAQQRGGAAEDIGANLTIWDTSDDETICPGENITFFANYSNSTSGEPILNADCNISFEDGVSALMWYNSSSLFYEYSRNFTNPGIYYYNVTCNATDYPTRFREDHAQVFICGTYLYGVNVTVINISKYNYTYEVGRYALKPGNITALDIDMNVSTEKWAGFYGNITNGTYLVLGDATGNFMYRWPWQGEAGKAKVVCTSTNGSLYFINLTGALGSEIDTAWDFLPSTADSGTNTFNQQCDITFGAYTIQNAACRPTGYSNFYTRALKIYPWLGNKDQMVFCTNITSATSFVDTPVDFELIVPTNYTMDTVETYYFYVSID